jgi:hypothetical protein
MTEALDQRLNQILPKITSDDFLRGHGIGNEIAFHIFDYPPEDELAVRRHIDDLLDFIPKRNYGKFGDLLAEVKAVTGKKPA